MDAHDQDPEREHERHPQTDAGAEDLQDGEQVGQTDHPSRHGTRTPPDRAGRQHEDAGHPDTEGVRQREDGLPSELVATGFEHLLGCSLVGAHECNRQSRSSERHREVQQPAAEHHAREEPILSIAEPIADDADEPEERDPGKGHQPQREVDPVSVRVEPFAGVTVDWRHGQPEHDGRRAEQHGEQDAGDRRRVWCGQPTAEVGGGRGHAGTGWIKWQTVAGIRPNRTTPASRPHPPVRVMTRRRTSRPEEIISILPACGAAATIDPQPAGISDSVRDPRGLERERSRRDPRPRTIQRTDDALGRRRALTPRRPVCIGDRAGAARAGARRLRQVDTGAALGRRRRTQGALARPRTDRQRSARPRPCGRQWPGPTT